MTDSLLPPHATPFERAMEQATRGIETVPVPLRAQWRYQDCPAHLLPWLAWAMGVDEWQADWREGQQRAAIRDSLALQRHKGSVWAMKQAVAAAGLGSARIIEGNSGHRHDGKARHGGRIKHGEPSQWAVCKVVLSTPLKNADAANTRRMLTAVMPARCHLTDILFEEGSCDHSGLLTYDGSFNHGAA